MNTRWTALAATFLAAAACSDGVDTPSSSATPTPTASGTSTPTPTGTPAGASCVDALAPGDHTVPCDGDITYEVRVPATCPVAGCGLVLDVHGFTMNGDMQDANTGMRSRGEEHGFVVVQPNAPGGSWNDSHYPLVNAFVEDAIEALAIDADRVHVTGFSQGGLMTFAMICRWPETWASAAPSAAAGGDCFETGTAPATRMPVLQIHGTNDGLVPFSAAESQRDAVIAAWSLGAGTVVDSGTGFLRTRYAGTGDALLELLQHDASSSVFLLGGHCFPGSEDPGTVPGQLASFACDAPSPFVFGQVVMDFFLAHPRGS